MGLVHCPGEDKVLLLLRWRCTVGVLHAELGLWILGLWILGLRILGLQILGLRILGLQILGVQSSELLSLLLPSSPQLVKSSCWLIPSNNVAMLAA